MVKSNAFDLCGCGNGIIWTSATSNNGTPVFSTRVTRTSQKTFLPATRPSNVSTWGDPLGTWENPKKFRHECFFFEQRLSCRVVWGRIQAKRIMPEFDQQQKQLAVGNFPWGKLHTQPAMNRWIVGVMLKRFIKGLLLNHSLLNFLKWFWEDSLLTSFFHFVLVKHTTEWLVNPVPKHVSQALPRTLRRDFPVGFWC